MMKGKRARNCDFARKWAPTHLETSTGKRRFDLKCVLILVMLTIDISKPEMVARQAGGAKAKQVRGLVDCAPTHTKW